MRNASKSCAILLPSESIAAERPALAGMIKGKVSNEYEDRGASR